MAKNKMVRCRYKHCKHDQKEIERDQAVKDGGAYYHPDCHQEKELMRSIEQYFINNINSQPIMQQLRTVINRLVYVQGKDPAFILFAMKYAVQNKIQLRYPPGLYYIIDRDDVIEAWRKRNRGQRKEFDFADVEDYTPTDGYTVQRPTGFGRILNNGTV